ncbi:MAG TPA: hypothetical protein VLX92_08905 [Kofleriaceae bacterium]|nr:hypothetical protein [Kofleriaceae bacterium]
MTPAQVVLLVVGILVSVGAVQAAIWIPITRRLRRLPGKLRDDFAAAGEAIVREPERVRFVRAHAGGGTLEIMGAAGLGERRLLVRSLRTTVEVPRSEIERVRIEKWFRSRRIAGRGFVVMSVASGDELALAVPYAVQDAWAAALAPPGVTGATAARAPAPAPSGAARGRPRGNA